MSRPVTVVLPHVRKILESKLSYLLGLLIPICTQFCNIRWIPPATTPYLVISFGVDHVDQFMVTSTRVLPTKTTCTAAKLEVILH